MKTSKGYFLITILTLTVASVLGYHKSNEEIVEEFNKNVDRAHTMNSHDPRVQELIQRIRNRQAQTHRMVDTVVCYGIGALIPGSWLNPQHHQIRRAADQLGENNAHLIDHYRQLELCHRFMREFHVASGRTFFADPIFVDIENELVESLGFTPDNHPNCDFPAGHDGLTIVFAAGLSGRLSENILRANWSPARMSNLIFIGTDIVPYIADKNNKFLKFGFHPQNLCGPRDYLGWEYVLEHNIAQVWTGRPGQGRLFDVMVTFTFRQRYLPEEAELLERFEHQMFQGTVRSVTPRFKKLGDMLKSGGAVGHMAVYGLGPFLSMGNPPSDDIERSKFEICAMIAIRDRLHAAGVFYPMLPMTGFEQQLLHANGFMTESNNQLSHTVTDLSSKTLVFVHGNPGEHWDNILAANWSPGQLNVLMIITGTQIDKARYALWDFLDQVGATHVHRPEQLYLYSFYIGNEIGALLNNVWPSVPSIVGERFVHEGGYMYQKTRGASLAVNPPPEPPAHMINKLGKDNWPERGEPGGSGS